MKKTGIERWLCFAALLLVACSGRGAETAADLIFVNGSVYTPDGWAEAVAVRGDTVVEVGTTRAVSRLRGPSTKIIELRDQVLFPGLQDSHAHPLLEARYHFQPCRVPGEPARAVVEGVRNCARAAAPGSWISSGPISPLLVEGGITRRDLDAAAPENPVLLEGAGTHASVLNTRALKEAGINRTTRAPPGGVIVRDGSGDPTGVLLDAWSLLPPGPPPPDRKVVAKETGWVLEQLLQVGVTSVTDAAARRLELEAYADLSDSGQLKPRVRACLMWTPSTTDTVDALLQEKFDREKLAVRCVKIFLDGESATARTAALLEPYVPHDGSRTSERGALALDLQTLTSAVTRFDKAGLTVKFHAWGDAAVDEALTAVEATRVANGTNGPRHEIGHVVLARQQDLQRAKISGVALEFSPWLWFPPAGQRVFKDISDGRIQKAWPVRDAIDAGVTAIGGTDWPTAPGRSPWAAIETLVTRLEPEELESPLYRFGPSSKGNAEPFAPAERITLKQAIDLFTRNPALLSAQTDAPGIIAAGRKADLVVLDRNPLRVPIDEVHKTVATMVLVGGQVVYERQVAGSRD